MNNNWQPSFTVQDFEVVAETKCYTGIVNILKRKLRFKMFAGDWGPVIERTCVTRPGTATVLLYQPEQDVVIMIEQFRAGVIGSCDSPWILEPVAGIIEEGYSAEETAVKESMEEAGCEILELIPIGKYLASPGISNEVTSVFCGWIKDYTVGSIHGVLAEDENIKVHVLPCAQAFALLTSGELLAAGSVICLQWLQLNYVELKRKWQ